MAWVLILAVNSQTVWILVCVRDIFTISLVINYQRIPLSLQQWCDDPLAWCHWLEDFALRHCSCFSSQLSVPFQTANDSAWVWSCLHRTEHNTTLPSTLLSRFSRRQISAHIPRQAHSFTQWAWCNPVAQETGAPWVTAVTLCCHCPGWGSSAFLITASWEQ